jgi:hypothetical protein
LKKDGKNQTLCFLTGPAEKMKVLKYRNHNFFKPADKRPECDQEKDDANSRIKVYPDYPLMIP